MTQPPNPNPYENTQNIGPQPTGEQWTQQSGFGPGVPNQGGPVQGPYPTGPQHQMGPQQQMGGQFGQPYAPPAGPSYFQRTPLPNLLAIGSGFAGVITFFMGFLAWISIDETIDKKAQDWADSNNGDIGIPAYYSPSLLFSPGWFFLGLGALGVAAFGFIAVKWFEKYLAPVAFGVVFCWLGLLACALGLPSFVSLGAGAIVALILGALQAGLLVAAALMKGLSEQK
ncbi:MAG: DUF5336 domain-containing protein [Gordonia sp. (in: high G+C Gram-positive bacteria)]